jgi:membrane-associated phospholipid phosphatase
VTARRRLVLGLVGVAATASVVRRDRVGRRELRLFRAANETPDGLYGPLWVVMQGGALGAVPVAAVAARVAGRPHLAARLATSGAGAWLLAKGVKRFVQRPRPVVLLPETRCRGPEATGLGYVSGHAAVSVAMASAALPRLGSRGRSGVLLAVPVIGFARMHVGAHLPLDVLGGAALGLAVDAATSLVVDGRLDERNARGVWNAPKARARD